jgi:hypothetical protein
VFKAAKDAIPPDRGDDHLDFRSEGTRPLLPMLVVPTPRAPFGGAHKKNRGFERSENSEKPSRVASATPAKRRAPAALRAEHRRSCTTAHEPGGQLP